MIEELVSHLFCRESCDDALDAIGRWECCSCPAGEVERVLAAALLFSKGDLERLRGALEASKLDWRDYLVFTGLAGVNWEEVVEKRLKESASQRP
jgi:hypothetical protein